MNVAPGLELEEQPVLAGARKPGRELDRLARGRRPVGRRVDVEEREIALAQHHQVTAGAEVRREPNGFAAATHLKDEPGLSSLLGDDVAFRDGVSRSGVGDGLRGWQRPIPGVAVDVEIRRERLAPAVVHEVGEHAVAARFGHGYRYGPRSVRR